MLFQEEKSVVHFQTTKFDMVLNCISNKNFKQTWKLHINVAVLKHTKALSIITYPL